MKLAEKLEFMAAHKIFGDQGTEERGGKIEILALISSVEVLSYGKRREDWTDFFSKWSILQDDSNDLGTFGIIHNAHPT
jgi:hypothetical protein